MRPKKREATKLEKKKNRKLVLISNSHQMKEAKNMKSSVKSKKDNDNSDRPHLTLANDRQIMIRDTEIWK
ncbi:24114_t:CDS:2 [Gigaspora rosea]|nr:24114_t:CDS:2 [Gigaspora rosea]